MQRIIDSYKQNQLDPWLDEAIFLGMADLLQGLTPEPPGLFQPVDPFSAPLLNPANYPSGGGGIPGIPPLSDMLGDIGDALFPNLGAPQDPSAPPMSRNLPPTGGY
mgnify:CR=1 FL=1